MQESKRFTCIQNQNKHDQRLLTHYSCINLDNNFIKSDLDYLGHMLLS